MALPIWGKFFGKLAKDKDTVYNKIQYAKFAKLDTSKRTIIITDCSKYHGWGAGVENSRDLTKIIESEVPSDLMENKYDNLYEEDLEKEPLEKGSAPSSPPQNKKAETSPANTEEKKNSSKKQEGK